jgi:hypothetical protein
MSSTNEDQAFDLHSAQSKPWEIMGRRATELTEGFPSDASRAARVIKIPVVFYMGKGA